MTRPIAIVEDDPGARDALATLIAAIGREASVFDRLTPFWRDYAPNRFDAVVLDVRLPDGNGVEALRRLTASPCAPGAIVLTGQGDVRLAVEAMKAGAEEFLEKPFQPAEFLRALDRAIASGRARVDEASAKRDAERRLEGLTPREVEVLQGIVEGARSREIAVTLGVSPRTVEAHRAHIMAKTGCDTVAKLVRLWTNLDFTRARSDSSQAQAHSDVESRKTTN